MERPAGRCPRPLPGPPHQGQARGEVTLLLLTPDPAGQTPPTISACSQNKSSCQSETNVLEAGAAPEPSQTWTQVRGASGHHAADTTRMGPG